MIALHKQGKSLRKIHAEIGKSLGISYGTIAKVVKAYRNGHALYSNLIDDVRSCTHPTNTDTPCVESEPLHTQQPSVDQQASVPPPLKQGDQSSTPLLDSTDSSLAETVHPTNTDVRNGTPPENTKSTLGKSVTLRTLIAALTETVHPTNTNSSLGKNCTPYEP